jgi:hypothetical protein
MPRRWKRKHKFAKPTDEEINAKISEFLEKNNYKSEEEAFVYKKYMKTEAWVKRRDTFLKKHGTSCEVCSSTEKVQAHHNNYQCVGREKDKDLLALCWQCHNEFHKRVKASSLRKPETHKKHLAEIDAYYPQAGNRDGRARVREAPSCSMCRKENLKCEYYTTHRAIRLCDKCYKQFQNKISVSDILLED